MVDCCIDCKCSLSDTGIFVWCPIVNGFRCIKCFKKFVEGGFHG